MWVNVSACMCVYVCVCVSEYLSVCLPACLSVSVCVCVSVRLCSRRPGAGMQMCRGYRNLQLLFDYQPAEPQANLPIEYKQH